MKVRHGSKSGSPSVGEPGHLPALALLVASLASTGPVGAAVGESRDQRPLEELTLEELMRVEVTSVVGVEQPSFASPAALYVITADDIRRSGHRTLFEVLRLVPGMFVARNASSGGIAGPRGLVGNVLTANRMLVLVDGRVVYDPLFNGTLWDVVDVVLEDIDRIEVIRGPGATLWGVNAMNGVIHVITRRARDTQGTLLIAGGGDPEEMFATARHGGTVGGAAYSVWGKYADHAPLELVNGESAHDQWTRARGGFRLDGGQPAGLQWTVQGDGYRHPTTRVSTRQPVPDRHLEFEQVITDDDIEGGFLRFAIEEGMGESSGFHLQGYYEHSSRLTSRVGIRRDTVQLDFRSWSNLGDRNSLVWGLQADHTADDLTDGPTFHFDPMERSWSTVNGFAQLTRALIPGRLFGLLGTKLTHHDFVGLEVQPSVRLWWTPDDRRTLWAAISRPVRVPSRLEESGLVVVAYADPGLLAGGPPTGVLPFGVAGNEDLEAETMVAYELGYRFEWGGGWQLHTALFLHDYDTLISIPPSVIGQWTDEGEGETAGIDLRAQRQLGRWRLELSGSWLDQDLEGPVLENEERAVPELMAQLRTSWEATERFQVHGALYYVDDVAGAFVDPYERLDVGLTWRLRNDVELALWGQNLIEDHVESGAEVIPSGWYLQVRLDL